MYPEKVQLNRKNFTEDIFKALRLIRHDKDFTDVTLVCEDDIPVRAHRVILASASSFFKAALMRKKVVRQRKLYLRGLTALEVETALDFLYLGEVSVGREEVASFIKVAQDLGLRGFERPCDENEGSAEVAKKPVEKETTKGAASESGETFSTLNTGQDSDETDVGKNKKSRSISETCKGKETTVFNDELEQLLGEEDIGDVTLNEKSKGSVEEEETAAGNPREDLDPPTLVSVAAVAGRPVKKRNRKEMRATLKTSLSYPDKEVEVDNVVDVKKPVNNVDEAAVSTEQLDSRIMSLMARREGLWTCTLCGKEKREKSCLSRHIEGVHISGVRHPCNLCQRVLTSRASLGAHKRKFHRKHIGLNF